MVFEASEACFSQLKGHSHVGYSESVESKEMVPSRQNLFLLIRERRVRFWGAIVGGQGSKMVNGGHKSNSEEGSYMKMICLTSKEFEMIVLMKISRIPT